MKRLVLRLSFAAALAALALPARAASGDLLAHLSFDDAGNGGANLLRASAGADAVVRATPTNAVEGIGGIAAVTDPSILSGLPEGDGAVSIPLGQHLAVPVPAALTDVPGHPYTVVMKIRTPSGAAWRTLVNMPASNDTDALAYIHKDSRKVCLKQHSKAGGSALASTAAVPSDAWTTVALVFGENTTEVFLDGTRALSGIGPLAGSYADCSLAGGSILFCADDSGEDGPIYVSDIRVYDDVPAELVLPIGSAAEWDAFAASVTAGTLHTNRIVRLVSDVPNAAEVAAGTTAVTTMVATKKYFRGTFDGRGHTLTVALDTTSNRTAPFVRIYGATIANLTVAGTVNSTMNPASGLVGYCDDATNAIVGCTVSAAVTAPYNVGGFVGHGGNGSLAIRDCVFSGTLSGFGQYAESSNKYAGGFLGSCGSLDLTVDNCLFKGAFSPSGSGLYHPIACRGTGTGTATVSGAYYLHTAAPTATGDALMPGADGTPVSAEFVAYRFTVPVAAADGNTYYAPYEATGSSDAPFVLFTVQDWNNFANDISAGRNADKRYLMLCDVGTAQNPAAVPAGSSDHPFRGSFDGGGHTLTVALTGTGTYLAPFSSISNATIGNLVVAGTVSGGMHCSGLVGLVAGGTNRIEDCEIAAAISTDKTHFGGVVGHGAAADTTLRGCVFSGSISGGTYVATLNAWSDAGATTRVVDCLDASAGDQPIGRGYGAAFVTNAYYAAAKDFSNGERLWSAGSRGRRAYAVTADADVTIDYGAPAAAYPATGLAAYADGLARGGSFYAEAGASIELRLAFTGTPPEGKRHGGFRASAGDLAKNGDAWELSMPAGDAVVSAVFVDPPDYGAWAAANGVEGAWDETDALGIRNVFRFAFDKPAGAFDDPPLLDIAIEDGNAVVKTPPVVNTVDFALSVVEASDVAGAKVTRRRSPDAAGRAEFAIYGAAPRFYRLAAKAGDAELDGVQLWENGPYWAECNVGAEKPEDYGYYFWWGDTVGYTPSGGTLTESGNYSGVTWVPRGHAQIIYSSPFDSDNTATTGKNNAALLAAGYIDSTGNLVAAHDAATAHLGAPWRMPTNAELWKLLDNCTTEWAIRNGVPGRLVTGKDAYSDRSIFLPAAGYCVNSSVLHPGTTGKYWVSTPQTDDPSCAWFIDFDSGYFKRNSSWRHWGRSVRPVRDAE